GQRRAAANRKEPAQARAPSPARKARWRACPARIARGRIMTRLSRAEDLLVLARQNLLAEDAERRFDVAVQSSRELELLYQAGVGFDAEAQLMPGDETRSAALVARTLSAIDQ